MQNRKDKGKLKDIKEEDQAKARQQKLYHYQKQLHKVRASTLGRPELCDSHAQIMPL